MYASFLLQLCMLSHYAIIQLGHSTWKSQALQRAVIAVSVAVDETLIINCIN